MHDRPACAAVRLCTLRHTYRYRYNRTVYRYALPTHNEVLSTGTHYRYTTGTLMVVAHVLAMHCQTIYYSAYNSGCRVCAMYLRYYDCTAVVDAHA